MKRIQYIKPYMRVCPMEYESLCESTPGGTEGLYNGDGSDGNINVGNDDDGEDGWGDVKGNKLWDNEW